MKPRRRSLTRTERILLVILGVLVVGWATEAILSRLYLQPKDQLQREIEDLAASLHRTRQLEARAAEIQRQYEQLRAEGDAQAGEKRSESNILLEIEKLAREGIRVHSLQPRPQVLEGVPVLHLSVEASCDLRSLGEFLQSAVDVLGAEVTSMTLTADAGGDRSSAVRSRIEFDVMYDGS